MRERVGKWVDGWVGCGGGKGVRGLVGRAHASDVFMLVQFRHSASKRWTRTAMTACVTHIASRP